MREHKYRAWDKEQKRMFYDGDYYYPGYFSNKLKSVTLPCSITNIGVCYAVCESSLDNSSFDHTSFQYKGVELMQYTGLKDKNGKEIYEGDIVARKGTTVWEDYTDAHGGKWSRSTNKKVDELGIIEYSSEKAEYETGNTKIWLGRYDDIEVIGNIYENPGLIEKAQA